MIILQSCFTNKDCFKILVWNTLLKHVHVFVSMFNIYSADFKKIIHKHMFMNLYIWMSWSDALQCLGFQSKRHYTSTWWTNSVLAHFCSKFNSDILHNPYYIICNSILFSKGNILTISNPVWWLDCILTPLS